MAGEGPGLSFRVWKATSGEARWQFTLHANETWRNQPEVLDRPLHDSDATFRSFGLASLRSHGIRAKTAAPAWHEMLDDPSPTVRPRAAPRRIYLMGGNSSGAIFRSALPACSRP